jgi:hypothetical protein
MLYRLKTTVDAFFCPVYIAIPHQIETSLLSSPRLDQGIGGQGQEGTPSAFWN